MTHLVTGATGYVGRVLVRHLLESGDCKGRSNNVPARRWAQAQDKKAPAYSTLHRTGQWTARRPTKTPATGNRRVDSNGIRLAEKNL